MRSRIRGGRNQNGAASRPERRVLAGPPARIGIIINGIMDWTKKLAPVVIVAIPFQIISSELHRERLEPHLSNDSAPPSLFLNFGVPAAASGNVAAGTVSHQFQPVPLRPPIVGPVLSSDAFDVTCANAHAVRTFRRGWSDALELNRPRYTAQFYRAAFRNLGHRIRGSTKP